MSSNKKFDLEERLIDFCVLIAEIVPELPNTTIGKHLADYLTRSALSSAFNYAESQAAESRRDFVHKLKVVLKELREVFMALKISHRLGLSGSKTKVSGAIQETDELIAIFFKSIDTAQKGS